MEPMRVASGGRRGKTVARGVLGMWEPPVGELGRWWEAACVQMTGGLLSMGTGEGQDG